ncbi:MAG TPA: transposase, partial [Desulfobacterales bacterium]
MARMARAVAPEYPHHVTQRGNRRQQTFFNDEDYQAYLGLMSHWSDVHGVQIWAYCLMPNHVHLIAGPKRKNGLNRAIGEVHRRYTRRVNFREGWRGHLWQGRFSYFIMQQSYLLARTKYIELNPIRADLVQKPQKWPWSNAGPHLKGRDEVLVTVKPLLEMVSTSWKRFLSTNAEDHKIELLKNHERAGRPPGEDVFV